MTMADDNRDRLLQEAELRLRGSEQGLGDLHKQLKSHFSQIDADKNGGLSMEELGAAMKQMGANINGPT
jgi:Ca2+-binding EF-hand superfamily protein